VYFSFTEIHFPTLITFLNQAKTPAQLHNNKEGGVCKVNKETGYNLCDQTSSCAPMISGPLPHQSTSVATITAGQQPGLSTKKQTDTCYMLFYVPFTPIIQCPEDEIYVPTLSANHPKIYLNLTTLGVQETCQPHAYKSLATCTVKPFL